MTTIEYLKDGRFIIGNFVGDGWTFKTIEPLANIDNLCYVVNEGDSE